MAFDTIPELTLDQVEARLRTPGFFVYDNNSRGRWYLGHVPTAAYLDVGSMTAADLPPDHSATLVFYCSGPG